MGDVLMDLGQELFNLLGLSVTVQNLIVLVGVGLVTALIVDNVVGGIGWFGSWIVGIIGGFAGQYAFTYFGIGGAMVGWMWPAIAAFAGAFVLLLIFGLLFRD